ncbi:DUF4249 family protein [Melioribacter sp. OK-6-Me]|uniref:DUF4249 family protein n=1 Tax=unclassified Melioribacter TaxID=2627329 RepID=UPI003ED9F272
MKMKFFYLMLILFMLTILSCNDAFNPYGDLKEKYVLNCIVRADTNYQVALLSKSYISENFDPYSNTEDKSIQNALVRLWSGNDNVVILKDTIVERAPDDKYKSPYRIYYAENFKPVAGQPLEIEAILPDGRVLSSSTTVPQQITFSGALSDTLIPPKKGDYIQVVWNSNQTKPVFVVRLGIYYFKHEGGTKKRYIYVVPHSYVEYEGKFVPDYPEPITQSRFSYDMTTIDKAMKLLSEGESDKSKFEILSCILEVIALDENLSIYYNTTANADNAFSVKLDEKDYSNIKGGYGVFGAYNRNYYVLRFTHDYIRSFGYIPGLKE